MSIGRVALIGVLSLASCSVLPPEPRLLVHQPDELHPTGQVEWRGDSGSQQQLRVRVASAPASSPDVLGSSRAEGGALVFTPRFPFQAGLAYRVSLAGANSLPREFRLPVSPLESRAELLEVSPAAAQVPANVLKFYLHFSEPMRRGEAYRHVRVLDSAQRVVEGAFIEIEPELWSPDRTRLTLLIDPGRIKRGLVLHEELGPVLYPRRDYLLEVDREWHDARGAPLITGHRHAFRTLAADLRSPEPEHWELQAPRAGSRDELAVRFDELLDRALVERWLSVETTAGQALSGEGRIDEDQGGWRFLPAAPWSAAPHALLVPALLEDLAGNSVGRPFEVEGREEDGPVLDEEAARVAFTPR